MVSSNWTWLIFANLQFKMKSWRFSFILLNIIRTEILEKFNIFFLL